MRILCFLVLSLFIGCTNVDPHPGVESEVRSLIVGTWHAPGQSKNWTFQESGVGTYCEYIESGHICLESAFSWKLSGNVIRVGPGKGHGFGESINKLQVMRSQEGTLVLKEIERGRLHELKKLQF